MTEARRDIHSEVSGKKSVQQTLTGIAHLIPSGVAITPVSELVSAHQYSLFLPKREGAFSYSDVVTHVIETGYKSSRKVDFTTNGTTPDMMQIPIGVQIARISIPDRFGGNPMGALIPYGIRALGRDRSVLGTNDYCSNGQYYVDIFERPIPDLAAEKRDELIARYTATRIPLSGDEQLAGSMASQEFVSIASIIDLTQRIDDNGSSYANVLFRFGPFDMRLLYPSLQEINDSSVSFEQLQTLYPKRIASLHDGYVTMGRLTLEKLPIEMLSSVNTTQGQPNVLLPTLSSLYQIYELGQAGFDIRLVEAETYPGFRDRDLPAPTEFAVMAKPL